MGRAAIPVPLCRCRTSGVGGLLTQGRDWLGAFSSLAGDRGGTLPWRSGRPFQTHVACWWLGHGLGPCLLTSVPLAFGG